MIKERLYNLKTRQIIANVSGDLFTAALKMDGCVVVEFDTEADIKALFRAYDDMQTAKDYISKKLESEKNKVSYIGAAVNDGMPHGYGTNDPVLRKAQLLLNQDAEVKKMEIDLARVKNNILVCDILLDQLTSEERKVIEFYYIKNTSSWGMVATQTYMSERDCRYKRDSAFKKMQAFLMQ